MQSRCEQLEREVDWVKSERDEALKSAEGAAARLKEAETAASRAKTLRRDELKKEKKDRNALVQRCEVGLGLCRTCNDHSSSKTWMTSSACPTSQVHVLCQLQWIICHMSNSNALACSKYCPWLPVMYRITPGFTSAL